MYFLICLTCLTIGTSLVASYNKQPELRTPTSLALQTNSQQNNLPKFRRANVTVIVKLLPTRF